jgi:uncharacterized damage-inducible protein DinB
MKLFESLRIQAHANRLANHRLLSAMAPLSAEAFTAPRTSFFPSLAGTLNHLLAVDLFYVSALHGEPEPDVVWARFSPATSLDQWGVRQSQVDQRLLLFCNQLDDATCSSTVRMPRGEGVVQHDSVAAVLMHLFMHQHHHRGQVHAMLSGTAIKPPQLDEFMMPSEAHLRATDMAALGLDEAQVYATHPQDRNP